MENIKEEIKIVAENLKKSEDSLNTAPDSHRALLVKSLVSEGLESIQNKMKDFSKSEKETLLEVLPEVIETLQKGQKAVTLDEGENVKFHVGDVHGTGADGRNGKGSVIQEDLANDDIDETLVKPEAARHNHQGDRSPEGIDDHEIKDPDEKKKKKKKGAMMKKSEGPNQVEHEELFKSVSKLASENVSGTDIAIEVLKKGYDLDTLNVVGDMIKFAIERNNRRDSMDTECPMYKDLSKMHNEGKSRDYMKGYGMAKGGMDEGDLSKMMDHMGVKMEKSTEQALAGGNMAGLKPNPEQSQVDDKLEELQEGVVRGDQTRPKDLKVDCENVAAQKKVDDLTQGMATVKKSVSWAQENHLLEVKDNFHSSVNDFYDQALLGPAEDLKKSEAPTPKTDAVADILEKGEDITACQSFVKSGLEGQLELPFAKPSFDVADVSAAFNISPKEQAEVLGE